MVGKREWFQIIRMEFDATKDSTIYLELGFQWAM